MSRAPQKPWPIATPEQARALRRKRIWNVGDLALYLGKSPEATRARLEPIDREVHGMLLKRIGGSVGWEFAVVTLAKAWPELFEPIESLEIRVEALEDGQDTLRAEHRQIASQVGQNTRDVAKMRAKSRAA